MARVSLSEDSPHVGHQSDYGKFHQKLKEGKIVSRLFSNLLAGLSQNSNSL